MSHQGQTHKGIIAPTSPPMGLYLSTGVDQAIFGTKFREQKKTQKGHAHPIKWL